MLLTKLIHRQKKISKVKIEQRAIIPIDKINLIGINYDGIIWRVTIYCGHNAVVTDCANEAEATSYVDQLHEAIRNYYD